MKYWLLKTEPQTYSWSDLVRDKETVWDGVRNYQARNYLREIKKNDKAFIYHSGGERLIIGIAIVVRGGYPEVENSDWVCINLKPEKTLKSPVTLQRIKQEKSLENMKLVKSSRLSVQPVLQEEFETILELSTQI